MTHNIKNEFISITVNEHGAELQSLKRLSDNQELLWQGDKEYWKGQSPILFPVVGNTYQREARFNGQRYDMPKHGFVRDADFTLVQKTADKLVFHTQANERTLKHYPFDFQFSVIYQLHGNELFIAFKIDSSKDKTMHYQIGAHPAFNLPDFDSKNDKYPHGYLGFDITDKLVSNGLRPGGYLWPEGSFDVPLNEEGLLPLRHHTFDCDTILDTRGIAHTCVLYNKDKKEIVRLSFDSPVLALWAPNGGCAPFVCIEPWWGSCDLEGYNGEFRNRYCMNSIEKATSKVHQYTITVNTD